MFKIWVMITPISIVIPYSYNDGTLCIWMQKRLSDPFKGLWEFPGGKIEESEDPVMGAIREVYEEVGVDLRPEDLKLLTVKHTFPKTNKIISLFVYLTDKLELFPAENRFVLQGKEDILAIKHQIPGPNINIFGMLETYLEEMA